MWLEFTVAAFICDGKSGRVACLCSGMVKQRKNLQHQIGRRLNVVLESSLAATMMKGKKYSRTCFVLMAITLATYAGEAQYSCKQYAWPSSA